MYLLKISITHNKKGIPLLNLIINLLPARLAPQMLSINGDYNFHFSNFLLIGLCNSFANFWFEIFSILTAPPEADLSPDLSDLSIINALSHNTLSEAVLLGKSLKSL